jgi:hypothetical protein
MGEHVRVGDLDIWTEQVGEGPDVLLIGGAGERVVCAELWNLEWTRTRPHRHGGRRRAER